MHGVSNSSNYLCMHQTNINRTAIFLIVVVERWASFYHNYDRQNVLASNISSNRPFWAWISIIEKEIIILERYPTHCWPICIAPFLNAYVSNWGVSHFEECNFLNLNMCIRLFFFEIANLIQVCWCKKFDEQIVENRIEIDRSKAEKYEVIHESCVFFITFFQPNVC